MTTPARVNTAYLHAVRRMGLIEGTSTLILFGIAMPLKYLANLPMAVRIVGSLHGFLFVALVLMLILAVRRIPISRGFAFLGVVAAIVPFGPFIYDRWLMACVPTTASTMAESPASQADNNTGNASDNESGSDDSGSDESGKNDQPGSQPDA